VHDVAFGAQTPTVLTVVVQLSAGTGEGPGATPPSMAGASLPVPAEPLEPEPVDPVPVVPGVAVPLDTVPVPAIPLPEQALIVGKVQLKPSPQSASTLQESSHLYLHVETLVVVQVGGLSGAKHWVFAGQVEPPLEQAMIESV
jgi:hypothetical protein